MMRLDELVAAGKLQAVRVRVPPERVPTTADAESEHRYGKLCAWTCEPNSRCIVDMMSAAGEPSWAIRGGFAYFGTQPLPRAHVWVTDGVEHFDPTWSRDPNPTPVLVDECRYFAVATPLPSDGILEYLQNLATEWGLDIADHHRDEDGDVDASRSDR